MNHYRFPVYLLGLPSSPAGTMSVISAWCAVASGLDLLDEDEDRALDIYTSKQGSKPASGAPDWDSADRETRAVIVGQHLVGQNGGSVTWYLDSYWTAVNWLQRRTNRYGRPSFVSVGKDLFWETLNAFREDTSAGLTWREFSILCGVNNAVGSKAVPFPVTRDFIRAASVGLKSPKGIFTADGTLTKDGAKAIGESTGLTLPTTQQTRDTLKELEDRGFIGRVVMSRRATAYFLPGKCSREDALKWLASKVNGGGAVDANREAERKILAAGRDNQSEPPRTTRKPLTTR